MRAARRLGRRRGSRRTSRREAPHGRSPATLLEDLLAVRDEQQRQVAARGFAELRGSRARRRPSCRSRSPRPPGCGGDRGARARPSSCSSIRCWCGYGRTSRLANEIVAGSPSRRARARPERAPARRRPAGSYGSKCSDAQWLSNIIRTRSMTCAASPTRAARSTPARRRAPCARGSTSRRTPSQPGVALEQPGLRVELRRARVERDANLRAEPTSSSTARSPSLPCTSS